MGFDLDVPTPGFSYAGVRFRECPQSDFSVRERTTRAVRALRQSVRQWTLESSSGHVGVSRIVTFHWYLELFQSLVIPPEWCLSCHLIL